MNKNKLTILFALVFSVAAGCGNDSSPDAGVGGKGGTAGHAAGGGGHGGSTLPGGGGAAGGAAGSGPAATFTVGGTIAGLTGTGLILRDNGGDDLAIPAGATTFTFATPMATGSAYAVTVATQPSSPAQICTVTQGEGAVGAANVVTVAITCQPATFTVSGTITGLTGSGLVLQNNASDDLTVPAGATTFAFATALASGVPYAVTVLTQPSAPAQTCTVAAGTGTIAAAGVTDVAITCAAASALTVGGTITGLTGTGLVLQNNAGDNLTVPAGATSFTFATPVTTGGAYAVTVLAQPTAPAQTCTVSAGTGTVAAASVSSVVVTCSTQTFTVGGTVSGLTGTGLVLQDNAGDNLTVAANATTFTFAKPLASGAAFAVTVLTQPTAPAQTCVVSGGTGTVATAPITSVVVNCAAGTFTVGGQITGLHGPVVLHNGSDNQTVAADGMFAFPTPLSTGAAYAVTVGTQPTTPSQTCTVTNGSGTVGTANVTTVMVSCATNSFQVKAVVTGLTGTGLVIKNNAESKAVTAAGTVTFPTSVLSGNGYSVTVTTQPTAPSQTCTVGANAAGVVAAADVTVAITCAVNTYNVHVTVSGLTGTGLVLHSGADSVPVTTSSTFNMPTKLASGASYQVTVATQPTGQICTVTPSAPATVANADVAVTVACVANSFHVSGMITGLTSSGLVLQNNSANNTTVASGATSFMFSTPATTGSMYNVSVLTQPAGQTCTPSANMGLVGSGDVTGVLITCVSPSYTVSAHVVGLTGSGLVLRNNGGDNLTIPGNNMTLPFATKVAMNQMFNVTVFTQPTAPAQTCVVSPMMGTVTSDVTVLVDCASPHTISGTITGLVNAGLVLRDNGGDDLTVPMSSATFMFATPVATGSNYAVTVATSPTDQFCSVTANASGPVAGANISNVAVDCAICGVWAEDTTNTLACPTGQTITGIDFASFGEAATGACGSYVASTSCNAATSLTTVQTACVGQPSCTITANTATFGDPCLGGTKALTLQARCQ